MDIKIPCNLRFVDIIHSTLLFFRLLLATVVERVACSAAPAVGRQQRNSAQYVGIRGSLLTREDKYLRVSHNRCVLVVLRWNKFGNNGKLRNTVLQFSKKYDIIFEQGDKDTLLLVRYLPTIL